MGTGKRKPKRSFRSYCANSTHATPGKFKKRRLKMGRPKNNFCPVYVRQEERKTNPDLPRCKKPHTYKGDCKLAGSGQLVAKDGHLAVGAASGSRATPHEVDRFASSRGFRFPGRNLPRMLAKSGTRTARRRGRASRRSLILRMIATMTAMRRWKLARSSLSATTRVRCASKPASQKLLHRQPYSNRQHSFDRTACFSLPNIGLALSRVHVSVA